GPCLTQPGRAPVCTASVASLHSNRCSETKLIISPTTSATLSRSESCLAYQKSNFDPHREKSCSHAWRRWFRVSSISTIRLARCYRVGQSDMIRRVDRITLREYGYEHALAGAARSGRGFHGTVLHFMLGIGIQRYLASDRVSPPD